MAKLSLELTEKEFLEHLDQIMSQLMNSTCLLLVVQAGLWTKWRDLKSRKAPYPAESKKKFFEYSQKERQYLFPVLSCRGLFVFVGRAF